MPIQRARHRDYSIDGKHPHRWAKHHGASQTERFEERCAQSWKMGPNTQFRKSKNRFLIGLNRAFSTKTHEILPLGALRNRKTNFLTNFRLPASSQMKIKGLLREVPLGPMKIEGKLSNSPFSKTGEYEAYLPLTPKMFDMRRKDNAKFLTWDISKSMIFPGLHNKSSILPNSNE